MGFQAERLQDHLDRIAAGEPVDDVLRAAAASGDVDQGALVELALRLSEVLPAPADPAFRADLQARLQAELAGRSSTQRISSGPTRRWQRWLLRLSAAAVMLGLALGTAVRASAESLPGGVLYPVKRATEEARLALAWTVTLRAQVQLDIANARIDEIARLVQRDAAVDPAVVEVLIAAYDGLAGTAEATHDPALADELSRAAAEHAEVLGALAQAATDPAVQYNVDRAQRALGTVTITLDAGAGSPPQDSGVATGAAPTAEIATVTPTAAGSPLPPGTSATAAPSPATARREPTAGTVVPPQAPLATAPVATATHAAAGATAPPRPAASPTAVPQPTSPPPTAEPSAPAGGHTKPTAEPTNPARAERETAMAENTRDAATRRAEQATHAPPRRTDGTPRTEVTPNRPIPTSPPVVEPTREVPPPPATP